MSDKARANSRLQISNAKYAEGWNRIFGKGGSVKYRVNFNHIIQKSMTVVIEAGSEKEAEEKLHAGDYDDSTEECVSEDGVEIKDVEIEEEEEE